MHLNDKLKERHILRWMTKERKKMKQYSRFMDFHFVEIYVFKINEKLFLYKISCTNYKIFVIRNLLISTY
jgi:hypothetical protein